VTRIDAVDVICRRIVRLIPELQAYEEQTAKPYKQDKIRRLVMSVMLRSRSQVKFQSIKNNRRRLFLTINSLISAAIIVIIIYDINQQRICLCAEILLEWRPNSGPKHAGIQTQLRARPSVV